MKKFNNVLDDYLESAEIIDQLIIMDQRNPFREWNDSQKIAKDNIKNVTVLSAALAIKAAVVTAIAQRGSPSSSKGKN